MDAPVMPVTLTEAQREDLEAAKELLDRLGADPQATLTTSRVVCDLAQVVSVAGQLLTSLGKAGLG